MARVADHLSITELEERFRTAKDPILARHAQVIWLLAQGHTTAQVSAVTSFGPRWIAQLLVRYNAEGVPALGDLRQRNGRAPSVLKPDLLERLRVRLADQPPDGGLWTRCRCRFLADPRRARPIRTGRHEPRPATAVQPQPPSAFSVRHSGPSPNAVPPGPGVSLPADALVVRSAGKYHAITLHCYGTNLSNWPMKLSNVKIDCFRNSRVTPPSMSTSHSRFRSPSESM
jgi:hypothetical protein